MKTPDAAAKATEQRLRKVIEMLVTAFVKPRTGGRLPVWLADELRAAGENAALDND